MTLNTNIAQKGIIEENHSSKYFSDALIEAINKTLRYRVIKI